jgi:G:T/U-mismatch repair DNA glycosylase
MKKITHKFKSFENKEDIEILILGTFNPDTGDNPAEFFYGRSKNYLWNLLPKVFGYKELKKESFQQKLNFIDQYKIGFADVIEEVGVEVGQEANYDDTYINSRVSKWWDFESFLKNHSNIKEIYFTRKSFSGVSNIETRVKLIQETCLKKGMKFAFLSTPSRFENEKKLNEWKQLFNR